MRDALVLQGIRGFVKFEHGTSVSTVLVRTVKAGHTEGKLGRTLTILGEAD